MSRQIRYDEHLYRASWVILIAIWILMVIAAIVVICLL
jgi:type IV secretory pathway component VirB8